jgi:hydrophobic/amphiphilic exporter-1 (mainly G- bacteria), HAE1 family
LLRPIVRWCLSNRAVVVLLTVILMGGGVVSMTQLNQQLLPNISLPAAFILVSEPGAGPDQVDRDVAIPISGALTGLPGSTHVQTNSSQGYSQITVLFDYGTNLKTDVDNVNQKLSQVQLPSAVGKPLVQTFDANTSPTMVYSLAARDGDLARITREANDVIVPALNGASGLAKVTLSGSAERQVAITLDPARMAAHGVSPQAVQQALKAAQVDVPVGTTTQAGKTLPVQVVGTARTVHDLEKLVVSAPSVGSAASASAPPTSTPSPSATSPSATSPSVPSAVAAQAPVTLGDVATVVDATTPVGGIARTDGRPSLTISAILAADGNAISLSKDVRDRLSRLHLDANDSLKLVYDTADDIQRSLNDLILEGLAGAGLAILVIFLFLRSVRGTLVTAISLPTSVLVALIGTKIAGYSLNVLTLAGLTIAIGRIVDDAIVVLENSYRHLQAGEAPRLAALNGASEVSMAIVSSTLTTVAVFLPIALVGGFVSLLFLSFAVTVAVALVASLLVALTIIPVLVSLLLGWRLRRGQERPPLLTRVYQPVLGWALGGWLRKLAVLVVTAAMLAVAVVSATRLPINLFDFGGSTQLFGRVTLPVGTSMEQTSEQLKTFEQKAQADPDVKMVNVQVASGSEGAISFAPQTNAASLTILVKDKKKADAVRKRLQSELDSLYGRGNANIQAGGGGGPGNNNFQATISGTDQTRMRRASEMILADLRHDSELTDAQSSLAANRPVVQVTVDPVKASARGLSPQVVAGALGQALSAQQVGTLGTGGPPVVLQVDPNSVGADRLATMPLLPGVQLQDVATVSNQLAPQSIDRDNGKQHLTVTAQILGNDTSGASQRATQRIRNLHLPGGVGLSTGGAQDLIGTSFSNMFLALGVAIGVVFLILVAFFRSLVTPLVILMTMPLSLIGGLLALFLFHQSLGLSALLGVLMLFGVVVSNAILLIDFTERERAKDRPLREALMAAGNVRLRPILMTALATVMALLPVATGFSTGGGGGLVSQSLAIVVEGGLISSTVLTLVVVPVIYSLVRRRWRRPEMQEELGVS